MEYIIAIASGVLGLFIYNRIVQSKADSGQRELEIKTAVLEEKDKNLQAKQEEIKQEEAEKVKEIENEQNKKPTIDQLVDFFRNRGGK